MIRIIAASSVFLIIGFILGQCSRPDSQEVVYETVYIHDTVRLVDTFRISDTVFISSVGEIRLVGCDTAFFRWSFETSHIFRMERETFLEKGLMVQGERLSQPWAVGAGIGIMDGDIFPYISIRYKRISGWIKPLRPYAGGVSIQLLAF